VEEVIHVARDVCLDEPKAVIEEEHRREHATGFGAKRTWFETKSRAYPLPEDGFACGQTDMRDNRSVRKEDCSQFCAVILTIEMEPSQQQLGSYVRSISVVEKKWRWKALT
jgi:hypothetical protein